MERGGAGARVLIAERRAAWAVLGWLAFASGCFMDTSGGPENGSRDFDGDWLVTVTTTFAQSCISVADNEVTEHSDGCQDPPQPLKNVKPGVISGNRVIWAFTAVYPGQGDLEIDIVYDVTEQPDGTLSGNRTQTFKPPGGPISAPETVSIVMTPN